MGELALFLLLIIFIFLWVTSTCTKAWMSLNFDLNLPPTMGLAALKGLKKLFSQVFSAISSQIFLIRANKQKRLNLGF